MMEPIILPRISDQKPLVSIISITYNHEPYIRECLDGFLMQKVDFPIEIIVHDDASTDHTADIIREYYEKRPDLFHVIIERENQQSRHTRVGLRLYDLAQGKYVALCEGDDYWIDPLKLQKQVDCCENNDVIGCVSYHYLDKDGVRTLDDFRRDVTVITKEMTNLHYFHTSTYVFRTSAVVEALKRYKELAMHSWADTIMFNCLCSLGDFKIIQEPLSCRRFTYRGKASSLTTKQHWHNIYLRQKTLLYLFGPREMKKYHRRPCIMGLIKSILDRDINIKIKWQSFRQLFFILTLSKKYCLDKNL